MQVPPSSSLLRFWDQSSLIGGASGPFCDYHECQFLTVGLATPPMGLVLFVASSVSGEKIESISKAILPFLAIEVIVIFLITYVEPISLGMSQVFWIDDSGGYWV